MGNVQKNMNICTCHVHKNTLSFQVMNTELKEGEFTEGAWILIVKLLKGRHTKTATIERNTQQVKGSGLYIDIHILTSISSCWFTDVSYEKTRQS